MQDDEGILEPTDEELEELGELELEDDEELVNFLQSAAGEEVDYLSLIGAEFDNPEEMEE